MSLLDRIFPAFFIAWSLLALAGVAVGDEWPRRIAFTIIFALLALMSAVHPASGSRREEWKP